MKKSILFCSVLFCSVKFGYCGDETQPVKTFDAIRSDIATGTLASTEAAFSEGTELAQEEGIKLQ